MSEHDSPDATAPLTFLFSDIEGSTRLWEEQPERMRAALKAHDELARASIEGWRGHLVRTMGDGVYAVFVHAADGVGAALQLQLGLADPAATAGLPLAVRCGLHLGTVERRDGDFYGPPVNRAARIMSIAHGGQVLLSQVVAAHAAERLPAPASLLDLGSVRLRDLSAPERVFQLLHPRLRAQFPPLRSLEATPNNLAQQLDSFVGREEELVQARARLAQGRLLTLLGMGGIGKSRLSVQLGAELLDDFPDGVWLVELAPLSDPQLVPQALAAVLGVKEDAGIGLAETLARYVRDKRVLFILDNCEHLLPACAELAKLLLRAGAGVKVLASSRSALQLAGELIYPVPTLGVPEAGATVLPQDLSRHAAVRLFVDRASAAQPAFAVTAANAAAVADICRRLDGIPLALELAAARTRSLPVQAIAQRLHDRFRLLVTRDETVLPRQRTLRALIDWSHDLLPERERVLFRRLAVFAGGWTLEGAEQVCGGGAIDALDILDLLTRLVDESLVLLEPGGERYRMLDTVRHYAQEKLAEAEDGDATRNAQLAFSLALAEAARPQLAGPEQGPWLARLDRERENFLAAHAWSEHAPGGDEAGLRLMHALRPYWIRRGNLSTGLRLAEEILARPGLQARSAARCKALFGAGQMSLFSGRDAQAREHLAECLAIAREIDDLTIVARVLQPLGVISWQQSDFAAARSYLEEALALAREQGDSRETAAALNALAWLHRLQGRLDEAAPLLEEAIALARDLGDTSVIGIGLLNLAMVAIGRGSNAQASTYLVEAVELADQTGSQPLTQSAIEVCAGLAAARRQWADAASLFGMADTQRRSTGHARDPADEAFLGPLIAAARQALGTEAFAAGETRGMQAQPGWLRRWLARNAIGG